MTLEQHTNDITSLQGVNVQRRISFTTSTTLSYTGISYTLPNNCCYFLSIINWQDNGNIQEIVVSKSSTSLIPATIMGRGDCRVNICGMTGSGNWGDDPPTLYVWARNSKANVSNTISINGFYRNG